MRILMFLAFLLAAAVPCTAKDLKNLPDIDRKAPGRIKITGRLWPDKPGEMHVCIWKDDKISAVSITSDNRFPDDVRWWREMCKKYNFKKTWFIVTEMVNKETGGFGSWEGNSKLVDEGFDIQSHSATHRDKKKNKPVEDDYSESVEAINKNMKNNRCLTIAYPGGGLPNDTELARKYFIAGRGTIGRTNAPDRTFYMNVGSLGAKLGMGSNRIPESLDPASKNYRHWMCYHFHMTKPAGRAAIEPALQYIHEHENDIWNARFTDAAQYGQERDTAKLKCLKNTASEISFSLTDDMDDALFDYPLTVKVCVPRDWKGAAASQGGKEAQCKFIQHENNNYVLVQAVPDRGETVIKRK